MLNNAVSFSIMTVTNLAVQPDESRFALQLSLILTCMEYLMSLVWLTKNWRYVELALGRLGNSYVLSSIFGRLSITLLKLNFFPKMYFFFSSHSLPGSRGAAFARQYSWVLSRLLVVNCQIPVISCQLPVLKTGSIF